MATYQTLEITGYQDRPVPNQLVRPEGGTNRLAILLPGFGYTCDMPLFYYAARLCLESGMDVLRIEYAYNKIPGFARLPAAERDRWLAADVTAAYRAAIAQGSHGALTLIGKSLGTAAMTHLLTMPDRFAGDVRAVWLTPAFRMPGLAGAMSRCPVPSLLIIGDADPHYDPAALETLHATTKPETLVIPGADHSLDIPGDLTASFAALQQAMQAVERFLLTG